MAPFFNVVRKGWNTFTSTERQNMAIYILGIMIYKFGLEAFNGSIVSLATNRYDYDAYITNTPPKTFQRVGLLVGLNQACQCVGSILIAPLIRRFSPRIVLVGAVLAFGILSALLLVIDAGTGGTFAPPEFRVNHPAHDFPYYGRYNTDGIIPVYCAAGIAYGMVELIRRVIPRSIVGGNVQKLRQLDALVHIFYEVSGTSGAFCTALALIPYFGNNYSFFITPICFVSAAICWFFLVDHSFQSRRTQVSETQFSYVQAVATGFWLFLESIWTGARILFSSRKFVWLVPGYAVALYAHRYLENSIAPAIARRYLGNAAWSQIIVGGSNLGELLGALFVILFTNLVTTPIPWLRLDSIMLLVTWYLPFWRPQYLNVSMAWIAAATFLPISFGWAAGDVSLAAYIQAALARVESRTENVSALGAVMAFLYSTYIVLYAITSPLLGSYIDQVYMKTGGPEGGGNIYEAIQNVASVQFTVVSVFVLAATFVPEGSWSLNPKMLFNDDLIHELPGLAPITSKDELDS